MKKGGGTYDGMSGAGRAWPCGRPWGNGGAPPPGRLGIAGAGRPVAAGGGPRPASICYKKHIKLKYKRSDHEYRGKHDIITGCCGGAVFLGPPGLGGDNRGLSLIPKNISFLTGGGTGVPTVAIDTSPKNK